MLVTKQDISTCILVIVKIGLKFHGNTSINFFWAQGGGNTSVASPFVPKKSLKSLKNQSLKNGSSYLKSFFTMKTF